MLQTIQKWLSPFIFQQKNPCPLAEVKFSYFYEKIALFSLS